MNEFALTLKYLGELHETYKSRGLTAAIGHEFRATFGSALLWFVGGADRIYSNPGSSGATPGAVSAAALNPRYRLESAEGVARRAETRARVREDLLTTGSLATLENLF